MADFSSQSPPLMPAFPRSMMRASADEVDQLELHVVAGEVPADLDGHLFLVAPVGSVSSQGLPNSDDSHVWNGNGLITRFDLQPGGPIKFTSRLARTPCYWADLATRPGTSRNHLGFADWGLVRFSPQLGVRNQLNTAFVPMRFSAEESTRLLITFDGGRPYEIDPLTLEVVTPVGGNNEWRAGTDIPMPFPPVLSTAHPVFDPTTLTLFSVNYGRSVANLLATIPLIARFSQWETMVRKWLWPLTLLAHTFLKPFRSLVENGKGSSDFVDLLAWDGHGMLRRWHLVDIDNHPLRIEQTMHQIGVTKDYVVLADTSVKWGLEQLLPGPFLKGAFLNLLLRTLLTRPQRPDTRIYIVRKTDLGKTMSNVLAKLVTLPLETGHFLVDRANPNGLITLYAAHEAASDVSEWLRPEDRLVIDDKAIDQGLEGMIAVGAMDIGRVGRYVIDAETGKLVHSQFLFDKCHTWGVGLYATPFDSGDVTGQDGRISTIYWQSLGFWPDLLTKFIYRLYANYPNRLIPLNDLLDSNQIARGRPSTLFCVDTATMKIVDYYAFPQQVLEDGAEQAWICNSPQYIPRKQKSVSSDRPKDERICSGYIFCVAISEQSKEIWIFDAANLSAGPLCRLAHPKFDPGYTIHSTWLQELQARTAKYTVGVREDYDPRLVEAPESVRELFYKEVYPHFLAD